MIKCRQRSHCVLAVYWTQQGVFHAASTGDGEALARDGQTFYALNHLSSQGDDTIAEILFGDGLWMLAMTKDLKICPWHLHTV